ncbi:MAG: glutathione S-transferase family protein [Pseudomonadota bacterium]
MSQTYKLHYAPDNASLVVRLALEELNVPYETVLVNRATKAHKAPQYLKLNPMGLIPVLETPNGPMSETAAILLWLADTHGVLAPKHDAQERAHFLKWLFFVSNTLHTALRTSFYPYCYVGIDRSAQAALQAQSWQEIPRFLDMLEADANSGKSVIGMSDPNCVDLYVAACLRWVVLYPMNADKSWFKSERFPNLIDMARRLEGRPSVEALCSAEGMTPHPFTEPDYPSPPEGSAT